MDLAKQIEIPSICDVLTGMCGTSVMASCVVARSRGRERVADNVGCLQPTLPAINRYLKLAACWRKDDRKNNFRSSLLRFNGAAIKIIAENIQQEKYPEDSWHTFNEAAFEAD